MRLLPARLDCNLRAWQGTLTYCTQRLCLRYEKRNQKTAKKEKKKKYPKTKKERGIKKENGNSGCPCIRWMRLYPSFYCLHPIIQILTSRSQDNISSNTYSMGQFFHRWPQVAKPNLVIWCLGLMSCSVVTGSSTLLPRCGHSIPFPTAKQSRRETVQPASRPAILHPSNSLMTMWLGWIANCELGACSLF